MRSKVCAILVLIPCLFLKLDAQPLLTMQVMSFDGKKGYVELPQNLFDNLTEGTIETWVKWEKFNKWSRVFDFGHENRAFVVQTEKAIIQLTFEFGKRSVGITKYRPGRN